MLDEDERILEAIREEDDVLDLEEKVNEKKTVEFFEEDLMLAEAVSRQLDLSENEEKDESQYFSIRYNYFKIISIFSLNRQCCEFSILEVNH